MFDLIRHNLLKAVMLADGGFCLVAGLVLAAFSTAISGLLGPALPDGAVTGIGLFLVAWGLFHILAGRGTSPSPISAWIAVLGDALWIAASVVLLVADWNGLTIIGASAVIVIGLAVADILLLKLAGLRSLGPMQPA